VCARLRVLPLSVTSDGAGRLLRIAMADPTDESAVAEIEQLTHCDVEISALPLSAIEELVDKGYRQVNTAVVTRPGNPGATMFVTSRGGLITRPTETESEISVTAQIPFATLHGPHGLHEVAPDAPDDLDARLAALVSVLVAKGVLTEAELVEALRKLKP